MTRKQSRTGNIGRCEARDHGDGEGDGDRVRQQERGTGHDHDMVERGGLRAWDGRVRGGLSAGFVYKRRRSGIIHASIITLIPPYLLDPIYTIVSHPTPSLSPYFHLKHNDPSAYPLATPIRPSTMKE